MFDGISIRTFSRTNRVSSGLAALFWEWPAMLLAALFAWSWGTKLADSRETMLVLDEVWGLVALRANAAFVALLLVEWAAGSCALSA